MGRGRDAAHAQGTPWPRAFARAIGVALKDQDDLTWVAPGSTAAGGAA
jgi:hypothetical protein